MARNRITIAASPGEVFETLADPFAYPDWVVGTGEVEDADPTWPARGARFSYRVGRFPLRWNGTTEVLVVEPDRRLVLRTTLPFGVVEIDIELQPDEDGTEVSLTECAIGSHTRAALDVAFHLRNAETLARLKALVEGGARGPVHSDALPALATGPHWLERAGYADVIAASERCYLAVSAKNGPHVTPTAFTYSSGRIWILTPRASLKARRLSKDPRAGLLFRAGDRSVIVGGRATVLDPVRMWLPRDLADRARAVPALGRYVADQRAILGGLFLGSLSSLGDLNPIDRVLISIAPDGVLMAERDVVIDRRGGRPDPDGAPESDAAPGEGPSLDLDEVPDSIAALAEGVRTPAVLAIDGPGGPLALPAHWHPERSLASVPSQLIGTFTEGAVGLCLDADGAALDDKEGMLVRGMGRVVGTRVGSAAVAVDQERTTMWRGADTATVTD